MPLSAFDPVDQEKSNNDAVSTAQELKRLSATATPDVAKRVSEIYKQAPYIPPSVILSMAKAGTSDSAVAAIQKTAALNYVKKNDPNKKEESWVSKHLFGNLKTTTRWTFAALQLLPDLAQNVGAEIFSPNDPAGLDGIIKSTQLGTMLSNSDLAGDGWFMGSKAADLQAERARKFRGEINGHAWTVGRAAGQLVFTPGSKPYNVLSGFLDAAVQVGADPTMWGGKAVKAARLGKATIPSLVGEEAVANAQRLARGEAGLISAEMAGFKQSEFGKFVLNDRRAVRVVKQFADIGADPTLTKEDKVLAVLEKFNFNISPDIAEQFASADTVDKVHGVLGLASSKLANSVDEVLLPRDVREISGATMFDAAVERMPLHRVRNSRLFATMPKERIVINGTGLDKSQAIRNYSNYLKGIGVGVTTDEYKNVMRQVIGAYSLAEPGAARDAVHAAFDNAVDVVKNKTGFKVRDDVWKQVVAAKKSVLGDARSYGGNELGWPDDGGMIQAMRMFIPQETLNKFPPDVWDRLVNVGPAALNQLADEVLMLPDYRTMRRVTGMLSKITTATPVEKVTDAIASAQNEYWKPLALATGGYIMRNMMDAQTRIAINGLSSAFRHPADFIMWVLHKKGFEDIRGVEFPNVIKSATDNWGKEQVEYVQALQDNIARHLERPNDANINAYRNGSWSDVSRAKDLEAHTTGYVDNLAQISTDVINNQIARFNLMGIDEARQNELIINWLKQPENKAYLNSLNEMARRGLKVADPETGAPHIISFGEDALDNFVTEWVKRQSQVRVANITRGDKDFNVIAAYNKVPLVIDREGQKIIAPIERRLNVDDLEFVTDTTPGTVVQLGDGTQGVIVNRYDMNDAVLDPFKGEKVAAKFVDVQPIAVNSAGEAINAIDIPAGKFNPRMLGESMGSTELRNLIDLKGSRGELNPVISKAERGVPQQVSRRGAAINKLMDKLVDKFFVDLYGRGTQILEKSPVFRQLYYREVFNAADELNPAEAAKLVARVTASSATEGISPARYVGGKDVWNKLREVAGSSSEATGTLEVLDSYAKAVAVGQTKRMLYNASERSNLEDILRIVVPFGSAWRDIVSNYWEAVVQDPTIIRKGQVIFDGARKFDPDGNGQGFFYRDPTSGEYSFNFPASGWITQHLTGVETPLQAPVKRLSIGLGLYPSIGPVAQLAVSKWLPDTPNLDFIRNILLPYGEVTGFGVTPRIMTRLADAVEANTTNLQTVYGNTYIEVLRALSTNGEYDLNDPQDYDKLLADARNKARIIAGLRAIGQFIGPTSPTPEFSLKLKGADIYASQLVKEFQKLQDPNSVGADGRPGNYDTAVQRFLDIYGEDAILYLSNKTESVAGGLEATKQFGDWERLHNSLFNKYPDVAGFMAPGGSSFDFEVWSRQVKSGRRRRLTDRELIELAQYRAAAAQYRELRDKLPASPTKEQKAWLKAWRVELNKQYPGFPVVAEFNPGEYPKKIEELRKLVNEPSLAENDVAQAVSLYLQKRDEALASAAQGGLSGLSGDRAAPLREWLIGIGKALRDQTPEFERIYDRLLAQEIED